MADKSIIIIGAGLAGLSTGVYAQRNGYRSRVFELHTQPGGGVPPAINSGRQVIQILCHGDGRPFRASE
jgi:monoamine oxidase